jgi:hypothetical protein
MTSWNRNQNKQIKKIFREEIIKNENFENENPIKILVGIPTYPRDGIVTYGLLKNTVNSLIASYKDIKNISIKFILIGDDYNNIEELKPIFTELMLDVDIYNINKDDALRNKKITKEVIWMHAVTRSVIFLFRKVLDVYSDYDYLLLSADDELYINSMLKTVVQYVKKYNYPDFVFSKGIHPSGIVYPTLVNNTNLLLNYPEPENCTESGTMYKIHNSKFINDIINFRKSRWNIIEQFIESNEVDHKRFGIRPEDAELWQYLNVKFKNKEYSSLLIPLILIDHLTEQTVFKYLNLNI